MWTNPTQPNIADFYAFVISQGVPVGDLPAGTLSTVSIDAQGNLIATSTTGAIQTGMVLIGSGVPANTYIATWDGSAGSVTPAPSAPVEVANAAAYTSWVQWAFNVAVDIALLAPPHLASLVYVLAVYNLGMHKLLKVAQDQSGQTFFAQQRAAFNLLSFKAGPVGASADQSTSSTLVTADFIRGLTMQGLDLLNTPWGREYLAYAQMAGPNVFGVN